MKARSPCLSLYSTSTEKLGILKKSGHCSLSECDVPQADRISVSAVLHSVSDDVLGDESLLRLRVMRGKIFSVAFSGSYFS